MFGDTPDYSIATLVPAYGMYSEPYATVYPDLSDQLGQIYTDKASQINWLPANWLTNVMALHGQNGMVLIPAPAGVTPPIPWLDSQNKIEWWNQFNQTAEQAIIAYSTNQSAQGAVLMQQAYDNAAFWDEAYNIATVAALPVTVARNVAAGVAAIGAGVNKLGGATTTALILGGVGLLVVGYIALRKKL